MRTIKIVASGFDDALRVMELLVPTAGIDNVSISPSALTDRWFVNIKDHGKGLAEMVETKMINVSEIL